MSEKKVVSRNLAIVLGIIAVILLVGLVGAIANYTSIINNKDTTYKTYASTYSHTNSEFNSLNASYYDYMGNYSHTNSEYNNYVANHHYTDSEYNSLLSSYNDYVANHHHTDEEYDSLTVASLTTVGLSVTNFNHYWVWDPSSHLTITGYIFNMGTDTAYNCKFHVKVWSSTNALLLDTTVDLGSISGRSYIYKSTETPYTGSGSYWSVIPEWTGTP
jgi:hypothetical protein